MSANPQVVDTPPTLQEFTDIFGELCRNGGRPRYGMKDFMSISHKYPRFFWQDVLLSFHCWHSTRSDECKRNCMLEKLEQVIQDYPDIFQRELLLDTVELNNNAQIGDRHDRGLHAAVLWPKTDLGKLLFDPHSPDIRSSILQMSTGSDSVRQSDAFHVIRRAILWRASQSVEYTTVVNALDQVAKFIEQHELDLRKDDWTDETKTLSSFLLDERRAEAFLAWAAIGIFWRNNDFQKVREHLKEEFVDALREFVEAPRDYEVARFIERLAQRNEGGDAVDKKSLDRLSNTIPKTLWTPLHLAAANGSNEMVEFLIKTCNNILRNLENSEKVDYKKKLITGFNDAKLMTPLHFAVLGNHLGVVKSLVEWNMFKPHVDACDVYMRTAFQIACSKEVQEKIAIEEQENIATLFFHCEKVDKDRKDCCLFTALHWATFSGREKVAKLLIERKVAHCEGGIVSLIKTYAKGDMQTRLLKIPPVKEEIERLYRDRQIYVDAANAILVGAALIAGVTFGGWFQPPVGINHDEDTAAVHIFWALNNLSFFFAIATVMAGASTVLPAGYGHMEDALRTIKNGLIWTSFLLILSAVSVLGAFAAAGFAALYGLRHLKKNMIVTTSFGSVVCTIAGLVYFYRLLRVIPDFKEILEYSKNVTQKMLRKTYSVFRGEFRRRQGPGQQGAALNSVKTMLENASFNSKVATVYKSVEDMSSESRKDLRDMWALGHQQECSFRICYKELEKCCLWDISMLECMNLEFCQYVEMWAAIENSLLGA